MAAASYSIALASGVSDPKQAQQFLPIILVPQLLFAGYFVPVSAIPDLLSWAQYLCVLKYAVNLGVIAEFGECDADQETLEAFPDFVQNCTALQLSHNVDPDRIYRDFGVLAAVFVTCRLLALGILVFRARYFM